MEVRCRTTQPASQPATDNIQFLVWPVHRTFARQWSRSVQTVCLEFTENLLELFPTRHNSQNSGGYHEFSIENSRRSWRIDDRWSQTDAPFLGNNDNSLKATIIQPNKQSCLLVKNVWKDQLFLVVAYQNHIYTERLWSWNDIGNTFLCPL